MIYFDNAATTMTKPKQVAEAVAMALTNFGNSGRGASEASMDASRIISVPDEKLSRLFTEEIQSRQSSPATPQKV